MQVDIEHRDYRDTLKRAAELGGADLIFTSPPYPDARPGQYGGEASHDFTWTDYQALGDAVFAGLRPGGFCGVVIDGPVRMWRSKAIGSERSLIAFKLAIDWAERVGLRYVEHCAYIRDGAPGLFGDRWRSGWEPLHVFQRPGLSNVDLGAYKIPARTAGKDASISSGRSAATKDGVIRHSRRVQPDVKHLTTALGHGYVNRASIDIEHHAPFADWLADAMVTCYSPPGGLVCDPFVGSATVAVSAAKHGRRFVGGDLGERQPNDARGVTAARWADIARERATAALPPGETTCF